MAIIKRLSIYRIDVGEIIKVAAYDESGAIGLALEHVHRAAGSHWHKRVEEYLPLQVEKLTSADEITYVHPHRLLASVDALCELLPGPCFISTSEY